MDFKTFRQISSYYHELYEGQVEWDNPKKPGQKGLTPRELNRLARIRTGVENPEHTPSDKQLKRYGDLLLAHQEQEGQKVPKNEVHQYPLITDSRGNKRETIGQNRRRWAHFMNMVPGYSIEDLKEPK